MHTKKHSTPQCEKDRAKARGETDDVQSRGDILWGREFLTANRLFRLLVPSARWPILSNAGLLLILCVVLFTVCWFDGTLRTVALGPGESAPYRFKLLGIRQDLFHYALPFAIMVSLWGFRRFLRAVGDLLRGFQDLLVLPSDSEARSALLQTLKTDLETVRDVIFSRGGQSANCGGGRRLWSSTRIAELVFVGFGLGLVIVFQVILVFRGHQPPTWGMSPSMHPVSYGFASVWCIYVFALFGGGLTGKVWLISYRLFKVVGEYARRDMLAIAPNAPDGHGGLMPIGRVAISLTYVLIGPLLLVPVWILQFGADVPGIAGGAICMAVALIAFFLPLQSTHRAMATSKQKELRRVSRLFRQEYDLLPTGGDKEQSQPHKAEELNNRLELMTKLDSVYHTVRSMPVWPFDVHTLIRFAVVALPPFVISLLTNHFKGFFAEGEPLREFLQMVRHLAGQ